MCGFYSPIKITREITKIWSFAFYIFETFDVVFFMELTWNYTRLSCLKTSPFRSYLAQKSSHVASTIIVCIEIENGLCEPNKQRFDKRWNNK